MPVTKISKEDILEKCWYVLHRNGYHHTSLGTLATEVGLGKAGLLHHFGSKEGLMRAVLDFAAQRYKAYVLAVAEEELSLEQRLEKMLRRQNRLAKIEDRGCFFGNTIVETSQEGLFNKQVSDFITLWQQTLRRLFLEELTSEQAEELSYLTLVEYQGAVTLYKISRDPSHLERYVHRAVDRLKRLQHEAS